MPQIRIKMNYGEIVLDFSDNKDLRVQLDKIDFKKLESLVTTKIPLVKKHATIIEEFKDLYMIDSAGNVMLKKIPKQKTDTIKLVVFLANRPLNTSEIKAATGITNPKSYMNLKREYIVEGDFFSLKADARVEVTKTIIPELRDLG